MEDIEFWLWVALAATAIVYKWIGRVLVSRPRHERPPIFQNTAVALVGALAPMITLVAIGVAGFAFTDYGWFYAICAAFVLFGLAARPHWA